MSKTRKIRRARNRAERAEVERDLMEKRLNDVEMRTANARQKFKYLVEMVGKLGHSDLFYALVHGVQYGGKVQQPRFNTVEHTADLHPRALEARADMADIAVATYHNLEAIGFAIEESPSVGHILQVTLGDKKVLAVDTKCIEHIPERMLALELGEYAAEAIKEIKPRV